MIDLVLGRIKCWHQGGGGERNATTVRQLEMIAQLTFPDDLFNAVCPKGALMHSVDAEGRIVTRAFGPIDERLFSVQQWLLWHLAVIGCPVDAEVLSECPIIKSKSEHGGSNKYTYSASVISNILELMVARGLVFAIEGSEGSEDCAGNGDSQSAGDNGDKSRIFRRRYGIHRHLQRYIFRTMDAPYIEYTETAQYTLTLYASQPNDVPNLSPSAHEKIKHTISGLLRYPSVALDPRQVADAESDTRTRKLHMRMLRAGYSVLRTVYSIANIAKFSDAHASVPHDALGEGSITRPGLFEEHRYLLRWLINEAVRLDKEISKETIQQEGKSLPFYAEEIVWLYNECGVLSITQGRMQDAAGLLKLADKAAETWIEQDEYGPLRTLIRLNRVVTDISRGRLLVARRFLNDILGIISEENDSESFLIAKGYQAYIYQLTGHTAPAEEIYKDIIEKLIKTRKSRAASTFSRYYATLLLHKEGAAIELALDKAKEAVLLSSENGHEDIRRLAQVTYAEIEIRSSEKIGLPEGYQSSEIPSKINKLLDEVENYAAIMGIPQLICA